jgi:hypothetical protein
MCTAVLIVCDPATPLLPAFGLKYDGYWPAKIERHLFVTPWAYSAVEYLGYKNFVLEGNTGDVMFYLLFILCTKGFQMCVLIFLASDLIN